MVLPFPSCDFPEAGGRQGLEPNAERESLEWTVRPGLTVSARFRSPAADPLPCPLLCCREESLPHRSGSHFPGSAVAPAFRFFPETTQAALRTDPVRIFDRHIAPGA